MLKVYYTRLANAPTDPKARHLLQCETARGMIRKALTENGFDPGIPLLKTESGKPYFENDPLYVSISHDGDMVVIAISDHPVGVDTEKIGRISSKLLVRFVGKSKVTKIGRIRLWTAYEAYGKYLGTGIPLPENAYPDESGCRHFLRGGYDICVFSVRKEAPSLEKM